MKAHARDRDTAAWLAREYGLKDTSKPLQISVGNSEPVTLSWAKVQRRIAQLIQSDNFYTEQEQDNFDNIDPIAIREALAERGIVNGQIVDAEANRNSPFVRQVMADVERIAAQEAQERMAQQEEPALDPADRFHVVSLDRGFRTLYAVWDDETHGYYVDADGVTEEFTSEWQAEAYRLELQGQAEQALTERARGLISDFCRSEYGSEADFSDPTKIGVAYTTVTDDEIPVQVNIDLVNFRLERYLDDEHLETRQYGSLQELIANELENLDFSDLIHVSDEDVEQYRWHAPEEAVAEAPGTAPAPQREPFPYSVGDTVYLENGKPYIIESVGVFDITLSDPTLFYPISRAESRESFARLMERYPQPERAPAYTEETVAVYPGDKNNLPYDVEIRTLRFDEPEHDPPAPLPPAENFRIMDDDLGKGGAKEKFWRNIKAIATLKQIEAEGRNATPEEQHILSQYVGWGGLADAFDPDKAGWRAEYDELKGVLSPEEYAAARASTLNAHYTSPTVIRAIYDAVENMGFQTGNILEPSMGVGNFFGMLPESMKSSRLYGVELDSITGRIAKQLYPKADITVAGFETTDRKDFFDLAVGNVPFGQYQVSDRAFDKLGFSIHNYFFAKALEQVRPGGVVAFVTSRYTMDAKDSAARKYIAQRADFLGAIRLPNNAFRANAGTDVVSDIIFLQKRDRPIEIEPDWVHTGIWRNPGANADGFAINQYFIDHPEMVLGRQTSESTQYGRQDFTVAPIEGADLAEQLSGAIRNIRGTYAEAELPDLGEDETIVETVPADPNVRNFSYTVVDGELYYRQNSIMTKPDFNATAKERAKGMVELRDCVQKLISQQMDGFISDETIRQTQAELNTLYDGFTAKYGLINSRANALAFAEDSSYYLLCSLEELDEDKNLKRKADMFTRRTIRAHEAVTSVDTASEALALSISEKACVDMAYMAQLTGKDEDALASDLRGVIFRNPENKRWETADEYLSGNVREKLRIAQSAQNLFEGDYAGNVEALKAAQPKDLDASEIEVRLGATWIDPSYIREFMWETFETPFYQQRMIDVNYSAFTAEWNIRNKNAVSYSNIAAYMTYGTERANAYKILEDTLNLRDVRIYDTKHDADGRERRVLNSKETTLAQQKQQAIKDAFRDWIWRDPDRRHTLVTRYNELFNSTRPREYDGSHITFAGMNPEIRLREHQLNAVAHVLYGGNTLLAHEVGAGKTFEMVAAAMESKRLGLCHKSLFVVPNHLTEQWSGEFLRLYPSANILVATKKDFEPKNRKKFCARIATGEYDAVIIGHSQFEKIPVSMERQQRLLAEQIFEVEEGLRELKSQRAERFTIKSLERTKRGLEAKLKKLQDSSRKDDVVTFEQLGVDRLYVDEAHNYKNLFLYTKMRNVAGLSATDAQKSSDMLLKCRYIDEITDSRGVVFATGTPVSNSMTELYTMMRYLQHDAIRGKGLAHFDCWASTFGETQTAIELAPEGTGYRARTRFAKFFNLPELMTLFKEAADIKTSDQLNLPTPTPIYHNEVAQPTEIQKQMVQELSERAARVHAQLVDPGTDNMLKITSDGRKLGLDQRIINPDLPDDPNSKVNRCVDNIHRIWQDGQADRLTQLVFCDLSTPKTGATGAKAAKTAGGNLDSPELNALEAVIGQDAAEEPAFTIYDDIREKLVSRGIPREQIAFIHEANTETRKKELFAKVRSGQVRVLMGSTFKMGAGMNVQDRLVALHDLDCPWRPGDLEQRSGRIIRQGNRNKEVHIYRYVTESTFDAYLWQTVENKQKFISQIMTSKSPVRSCEDVDETALSYAEIKALCAGDKRIKEKMDLDVDVARLKLMKASHQSQQFRLEDNLLRHFPEQIRQNESFIEGFTADMQTLSAHPHPVDGFAGMEVKGDLLTDKDNAGAAILEAFKDAKGMEPVPIGSYRGFAMSLTVEDFGRDFVLTLKGKMNHRVTLGKDARGNLTRIDNALNAMPDRLQNVRNTLDALTAQMETAKAELGKPFPQEDELRTKSARLAELNAELNIDDRTPMEQMAEDAPAVQSAKAERPSVLAKLKAPLSQPCAEDKIRHRGKEER
ncbi:SNF2-related protein [Faecalibacterium sp.]|uniref:SNF2-related protein n=1 Tax=Faecalibacterium sp. TaxID=1971605 RepID=UPI00345C69C0